MVPEIQKLKLNCRQNKKIRAKIILVEPDKDATKNVGICLCIERRTDDVVDNDIQPSCGKISGRFATDPRSFPRSPDSKTYLRSENRNHLLLIYQMRKLDPIIYDVLK